MKEPYRMILKVIFIIIITFLIANYYTNLILNKYVMKGETSLVIRQFASIIYYAIISFGVIVCLIQVGIQSSTILTVLGTVGFTCGLSVQGTLSRGVSGVYIMLENLYEIGDYIDTTRSKGYVKKFNFFNTILYDNINNLDILVPNNLIDSNVLINYTKSGVKKGFNL